MLMKPPFFFRTAAHLICAGFAAALVWWMWPDFGAFPAMERWSMILGYLAFVLIGLTLMIGPAKTWLPSRWAAASLSIRRDVGIWAGAAAFLHVTLVVILFEGTPRFFFLDNGGAERMDGWLGLFFLSSAHFDRSLVLNLSLFGIANYIGLFAFCILLSLWLTSSDRAEKWLGGSSWKRLHMANPLLFTLASIHGLIYIQSIKGEPHTPADILLLAALVACLRGIAFVCTCARRRQ